MATVIFYNFILLSSTFFVWLSEKGKGNLERYFFLGLAFLLVFVPAAIRYDVGTDYVNYLAIYQDSWRLESYKKEPGFYFINWFYQSINAHFQWMFATFAFIFTAAAFKAYPRKNAWLLHFLVFTMLWFSSFNIIRQDIAVVFCLLAVFKFFEKRYVWFILLTLAGSTFHQSALFITAAGLMTLIPLSWHIKTRLAPLVFVGFIIFTYVSMNMVLVYMEQTLNLIGLTKYAGYFSSAKHFVVRDFGSGIGVLAKILFSIYVILNAKAFIQLNKNYWLLIVLVFVYAVGVVLANKIIIFVRMAHTFNLAPILGAFLLFLMPNKRMHKIVACLFMIFMLLTFIKTSFGIPTSYSDPKLNPYKNILILSYSL